MLSEWVRKWSTISEQVNKGIGEQLSDCESEQVGRRVTE